MDSPKFNAETRNERIVYPPFFDDSKRVRPVRNLSAYRVSDEESSIKEVAGGKALRRRVNRAVSPSTRPTSPTSATSSHRFPEDVSVDATTIQFENRKGHTTVSGTVQQASRHSSTLSPPASPIPQTSIDVATVNSYIDKFIQEKEERKVEKERITNLMAQLEQEFETAQHTNGTLQAQVDQLKQSLHRQQYTIVQMRQQYDKAMEDQEVCLKAEYQLMIQDSNARFAQIDSICRRQQDYIDNMEQRIKAEEEKTRNSSCGASLATTACSSVSSSSAFQTDNFEDWWSRLFFSGSSKD